MQIGEVFEKTIQTVKDFTFPVFCLDCGREGEWLCSICFQKLNLVGIFFCPICHDKTELGKCCEKCQDKSFLFSHIAITPYEEGALIGKMIYTLKYSYAEDVATVFERLIIDFVSKNKTLFENIDLIIPVPLHKKRYAERGFNQAEIIAKIFSQALKIPLSSAVRRTRYTGKQAKLGREERLQNLKNAFAVEDDVQNKNILLVDDVFTTGSTLQACAEVLSKAGAREVKGFSVARG